MRTRLRLPDRSEICAACATAPTRWSASVTTRKPGTHSTRSPNWRIRDPDCHGAVLASVEIVCATSAEDLGDELRQVHLAARAAQDVPVVVVLTEKRLVPLFERSFPAVRFISEISDIDPQLRMPVTSYEQLAYFYGREEESIRNGFLPLTPPPAPQRERRGLGISWYSKAMYKNLPDLNDWAEVLKTVPGRVQSLQYRERAAGRRMLAQLSGRPIRTSRAVNQFLDLDGYAGQIASVRRVLTISNTTAHMAGALGIPCVVVLDDESVTTWPAHREQSPFYPNTRLIRRRGRDWQTALREGLELLQSIQVQPGTMHPQTKL